MKLDEKSKKRGVALQKLAAVMQYTVYGVPSIFYGDEAGIEGYGDPFCRRTYPWGRECEELLSFYRKLGKIRRSNKVFDKGEFRVDYAQGPVIVYSRYDDNGRITVAVNVSDEEFAYPLGRDKKNLLTGREYKGSIAPMTAVILK
jgi:glycosidase